MGDGNILSNIWWHVRQSNYRSFKSRMSGNQCKTSKPYHSFPLIAQLILWKRNVAFSETEIPTMASGANGLASPLSGYLVLEGQIGRGAGGGRQTSLARHIQLISQLCSYDNTIPVISRNIKDLRSMVSQSPTYVVLSPTSTMAMVSWGCLMLGERDYWSILKPPACQFLLECFCRAPNSWAGECWPLSIGRKVFWFVH